MRSKPLKYKNLPRILISILSFLLLFSTISLIPAQQPTLKPKTVVLQVAVTDNKGNPIPGLKREQFKVFEKKNELPITSFDAEDEPASVVLMFDVSASVDPRIRAQFVQLAAQFANSSNNSTDYHVIAFGEETKLLCGWNCAGHQLQKALNEVIRIRPQERTMLYDAWHLALARLESSQHRKHLLIVFADGQDDMSKIRFSSLREITRESSAIAYAIGNNGWREGSDFLNSDGLLVLDELAAGSGGKSLYPQNRKEIPEIADFLAADFRNLYRISFVVENPTYDNKWHAIQMKLKVEPDSRGKVPNLYLRYREGYYDR